MKRYPAWQAVYRSFYSMDFYRDVAEHWGEIGYLYLLLLAGIYWVMMTIAFQLVLNAGIDRYLLPFIQQMPTLKAVDGKFQIDKPCPYTVKVGTQDLFIFDTTGQTQTLESPGFLITDQEIRLFGGAGSKYSTGTDSLSSSQSKMQVLFKSTDLTSTISPDVLRGFAEFFQRYMWIGIFLGGWFCGTLFLYFVALIYAVIGLIFNAINETHLKFVQLLRLAAIAITPPLLIEGFLKLGVHICNPFGPTGYEFFMRCAGFIAAMIYLFLGIKACKGLAQTAPTSQTPPTSPTSPLDS